MRIAIGGIAHETSSFTPVPTTRADFETGFGFYRGREIVSRFSGANVAIGGFLLAAVELGFEPVPILWTYAYPGGVPDASVYRELVDAFLSRLRRKLPLDGVLLDQHGAMMVEGIDDADGAFLEEVRAAVGPDCPIAVTYDLHSNHTKRRIAAADVSIGYETFPHVDQMERGREAAALVTRMLRQGLRPETAFVQVPLYWHPSRQISGMWPWRDAVEQIHAIESRPGILSATIATGFPFSDVPDRGPSVIVVADGDRNLAARSAHDLASWIWERRRDWLAPVLSVEDALARGRVAGRYPIILADHADNTGAGSPGDSTEVLRTLLKERIDDALVLYVVDPETVAAAHAAGVGATIDVDVGGKSHPAQGSPVPMRVHVVALSDGTFTYDGPMFRGLTGDLGPSAAIRQDGVTVVCVTAREQPFDTAFARSLGIDCASMRVICVKSTAHFRSGFEPIAAGIYNVDAQAVHSFDLRTVAFLCGRRPMFGIDVLETDD